MVISHHGLNRKIEKRKKMNLERKDLGSWMTTDWMKKLGKKEKKRKNELDLDEYDDDVLVHAHHHNYTL